MHHYPSILFVGIIIICVISVGCTGMSDLWREHISPLDYIALFEIAIDLTSPEKADNIAGLDALVGTGNTQKIVTWYEASILAIKAGKAILEHVKSRDVRVTALINRYERTKGTHGN